MQTLYSLIFFKDDQPLSCRIVRMEISDLPQILAFQQEIYQNLPDKDILFPLPQEDWEYLMNHGFTLAVFPEESDPAGLPHRLPLPQTGGKSGIGRRPAG